MNSDPFLIPDIELNDPDRTLDELQKDICNRFDNICALEPGDNGRYTVSVSRPVPIEQGKQVGDFLGVEYSERYWPSVQRDLKIEITKYPFDRVFKCINKAVYSADHRVNVQNFAATVRKVENGRETTSIIVPAARGAAKQDTVLYYLVDSGIFDHDQALREMP